MIHARRSTKVLILMLLALILSVVMLVGCDSQSVNQPTSQPANTPTAVENQPVAEVSTESVPEGFPPHTTHPLEGREDCASCHNEGVGGAPKTPHPELTVCRQCHV